jgi:hypothetical protein
MRNVPHPFTLLAAAFTMLSPLHAAETTLESGPRKTRLLELFTSEGCSSCPPAETWLSTLKDERGLWRDFVPLAFHVDYWDRLGWRDPFAAKAWTQRQYAHSARWKSGSVYTPGFVLDGREWRRTDGAPSAEANTPGTLKVSVLNGDAVIARFEPPAGSKRPLELHVARLGFGLNINVKAGENSGRKLLHDFVVLSLDTATMNAGKAELRMAPAPERAAAASRTAIAAWLTEPGQMEPIQAVGGWLR